MEKERRDPAVQQRLGMVLSIARNIYSGSEQLGVVKADVRYTILNDCYGKDFNGLGAIYIIDPVSERIIYPLDVPQQIGAQLLTSGGQGEASGSGYAEIDGVSSLVIYQRSELTGWLTLGVVPESDVTREFRSVSLTAMAVSLLFGVVAVAFLAVFCSVKPQNPEAVHCCSTDRRTESANAARDSLRRRD